MFVFDCVSACLHPMHSSNNKLIQNVQTCFSELIRMRQIVMNGTTLSMGDETAGFGV